MLCLTKTCRHGLAIKTGVSPRVLLPSTLQMALLAVVSCNCLGWIIFVHVQVHVGDASFVQPCSSAKFLLLKKDAQSNLA